MLGVAKIALISCLVLIDPGAEVADASVDRWEGRIALSLSPGRQSNLNASNRGGATTVTTACADRISKKADVTGVDLCRAPSAGAVGVCQNSHCALLENGRDRARSRSSAPAGNGNGASGVVSSVRRRHVGETSVTVGSYGRSPSDDSDIVRVALVTVIHEAAMSREG